MTTLDFVKSSYSSSGGECVEVAAQIPGLVAIRDSKTPDSTVLRVARSAWAPFLQFVMDDAVILRAAQ